MGITNRYSSSFRLFEVCLFFSAVMVSGSEEHYQEVCSDETFKPQCGKNEVIFIESAYYGRKLKGRCVSKKDKECVKDVKHFISSKCSGKQSCNVVVTKTETFFKQQSPCASDYTWHLYSHYKCIPVEVAEASQCLHGTVIPVTSPNGYLSSHVAKTGPGSEQCPWHIKVAAGQRIQVTVYNFGNRYKRNSNADNCKTFARITEGKASHPVAVCTSDLPEKVDFMSLTNNIRIAFKKNIHTSHPYTPSEYLIKYEATGCPDLQKIKGATHSRTGNDMVVQCNSSHDKWYLTCEGVEWKGKIANCSRTHEAEAQGWTLFDSNQGFPYALVLVVAIGVALGILLGGTTLIIVSYRMKRKHPRYEMPPEPCLNYNASSIRGMEKDKSSGQLYTGTTALRRQWSDGTNTTILHPTQQPHHHHTQHMSTPPDYNFNSNGKTEQIPVDNIHSAPHLYESPQGT